MAGIEELTPPMSSDPNARMWAQIKALQGRVALLEKRRDLTYRASVSAYAPAGDSFTFETAGRPLLIVFGPNRLLLPAASGPAPRLGNAYAAFNWPTGTYTASTVATSFDTNANGAFQTTNVNSWVERGVPPGTYTCTLSQSGGTELRYSIMILELPA